MVSVWARFHFIKKYVEDFCVFFSRGTECELLKKAKQEIVAERIKGEINT